MLLIRMKLLVFKLKTMFGWLKYLSRWTDSCSEIGSERKRVLIHFNIIENCEMALPRKVCKTVTRHCQKYLVKPSYRLHTIGWTILKLEYLTLLKCSPDLLNNVKIGQDHLWHIIKHILFYWGCGHFGQVT